MTKQLARQISDLIAIEFGKTALSKQCKSDLTAQNAFLSGSTLFATHCELYKKYEIMKTRLFKYIVNSTTQKMKTFR